MSAPSQKIRDTANLCLDKISLSDDENVVSKSSEFRSFLASLTDHEVVENEYEIEQAFSWSGVDPMRISMRSIQSRIDAHARKAARTTEQIAKDAALLAAYEKRAREAKRLRNAYTRP